MAVTAGYALDKANLDQQMGQAVTGLRDALAACVRLRDTLNDPNRCSDELLTAMGYDTAGIGHARAAFAALGDLSDIAHAQATQPAVNDFFFDAIYLMGAR
jgi:hypothetical protein